MAHTHARLPRARSSEELLVEELPDELLIYDHVQHKAHCLNQSAAIIWRACDGETTMLELLERLAAKGLPAETAVVEHALVALGQAGLIEAQEAVQSGPDALARSRRKALKHLGLIAGTALALPLVQSIWAPAAAQNTSTCGGFLQPCCRNLPRNQQCDDSSLRCRGAICR